MLKNVFLYLILLFLFAQVHSIGFNYMINGDLSSPPLTTASPTQTITTSILGWSGNNFQISLASAFSTIMCGNLPVLVVGTAPVTEALALPITEAYQLSFVWSTLNGSPFDDKTVATVRWNGQIVLTITPKAQLVNRETFQVHSHAGINTISLTAGTNRLLFSQFTLTHINMVINPIFNYPSVTTPTIFNSGILGWQGKMVNIGQPKAFNPNFDTPSLNTVANTIQNATQTYHCAASGRSYNISMIWAARSSVSVSQQRANIQWNGITIGSLVPTDYNLRYFQTTVLAIVGSNQLNIVSLPFSATDGVIVSSVSVIQMF